MSLIVVADDDVPDWPAAEVGKRFCGGLRDRNFDGGGITEFAGFRIVLPSITSTLLGCGERFDTETGLQLVSKAALLIRRIEVDGRFDMCRLFTLFVFEFLRLRDDESIPEVLAAVGS